MSAVARPLVKYFGSKWRMFPWIYSFFPPHVCYVEAFAGGASTLLQKPPSKIEVMNDRNKRVINLFKVLRERPQELIRWIELTPWARVEQLLSYEESEDPLEDARRFYVQAWQSYGGAPATANTGWRYDVNGLRSQTNLENWNDITHLWNIADRLKDIHIECDDAFEVIKRYDAETTLFFLDPPYVANTLTTRARKVYPGSFTDEDHQRLLELLNSLKGYVILCGYASNIYAASLLNWTHKVKAFVGDFDTEHTESLWLNPACTDAFKQLDLFGVMNGHLEPRGTGSAGSSGETPAPANPPNPKTRRTGTRKR